MNTRTQTYPLTDAAREGFRAVLDVHDDGERIEVHVTSETGHPSGWSRFILAGAEAATAADVAELEAQVRAVLAEGRAGEDRFVALDEVVQSWSAEMAERGHYEGRHVVPTPAHVDDGLWADLTADTTDEDLDELAAGYVSEAPADGAVPAFTLDELTAYARERRNQLRADRAADEG